MRKVLVSLIVLVLLVGAMAVFLRMADPAPWSDAEMAMLRSLWIGSLQPLPPDPSNTVADDPRAADLGNSLFFDTRLSANGRVSCATCHRPERRFADGLPRGVGIGRTKRNTPSIVGAAYSPWQYWDGRKDSQWSQALAPIEDPNEHGFSRLQVARLMADDAAYRKAYEGLFGALPDFTDPDRFPEAAAPVSGTALDAAWRSMASGDRDLVNRVFVNAGKAIAAFERLLAPGESRFDRYVQDLLEGRDGDFSSDEIRGLRLFIGEARCTECHNGPLLTNNEFHNTGHLSFPGEVPDRGRADGVRKVKSDPFNCLGAYSDAPADACAELRFARTGPELIGALRTPSLRNLEGTEPYAHKGQIADLAGILKHYNEAPEALIGHNEAEPLGLSRREMAQIEAFLRTLAAPLAASPVRLEAPLADE